tara:strand:- start:240 stop:482 length:243 start_codon:yes stop_codon:yes gene_type:complete
MSRLIIKKIKDKPYHIGNRLNGQASAAGYGIFKDGEQVGYCLKTTGLPIWDAYDLKTNKRINGYGSSLGNLKLQLAKLTN